jgi:hypothetical protein
MKINPLPSAEYLRSVFDYNPETGVLVWKHRHDMARAWNAKHVGKTAGCVGPLGYILVRINRQLFLAHRIIYKMMKGSDPEDEIDHKNGHPGDNRWTHLRDASSQQNKYNRQSVKRKHDLPRGVYPHRCKSKPFGAYIKLNSKRVFLGSRSTPGEAHSLFLAAAEQAQGIYAYHTRGAL